MLIISNCLTDIVDEGCLKVCNSIIRRIKKKHPETSIITYERDSELSDMHLQVNKLLLNKKLLSAVRKSQDSILYLPFPAKTIATAMRIFVLSLFARKKLSVFMILKAPFGKAAKMFLRLSKAELVVLSKDAESFYSDIVPRSKVRYLKTGVDVNKFTPVDENTKNNLKEKLGLNPQKPVILHVGHLKQGRNVPQLLKISSKYQVVLITSTLTKDEQDSDLRRQLEEKNVRIIDSYLPAIEEIYQASDLYFFPVVQMGNCIDVPLSCMEAAACNIPVITTDFGEMSEFRGKQGFSFIGSFDEESLNKLIAEALTSDCVRTREAVLDYHWDNAVKILTTD